MQNSIFLMRNSGQLPESRATQPADQMSNVGGISARLCQDDFSQPGIVNVHRPLQRTEPRLSSHPIG